MSTLIVFDTAFAPVKWKLNWEGIELLLIDVFCQNLLAFCKVNEKNVWIIFQTNVVLEAHKSIYIWVLIQVFDGQNR